MQNDKLKMCGSCKHYKWFSDEEEYGAGYFGCGNDDSDLFCDEVWTNDNCEMWEGKA